MQGQMAGCVQQIIRDAVSPGDVNLKYNCAFITFLQFARNLLRLILYANTGEL